MDLEVLGAPVALGEGEAVALQRAFLSSGAEQHLVDGEGGDLSACGLVHHPAESLFNMCTWKLEFQ